MDWEFRYCNVETDQRTFYCSTVTSFTSSTDILGRSFLLYFHAYECPEILTPSYSDMDLYSGTYG